MYLALGNQKPRTTKHDNEIFHWSPRKMEKKEDWPRVAHDKTATGLNIISFPALCFVKSFFLFFLWGHKLQRNREKLCKPIALANNLTLEECCLREIWFNFGPIDALSIYIIHQNPLRTLCVLSINFYLFLNKWETHCINREPEETMAKPQRLDKKKNQECNTQTSRQELRSEEPQTKRKCTQEASFYSKKSPDHLSY